MRSYDCCFSRIERARAEDINSSTYVLVLIQPIATRDYYIVPTIIIIIIINKLISIKTKNFWLDYKLKWGNIVS